MKAVSFTEARVEAMKLSKASKDVVISVVPNENGEDFDVVEGDDPFAHLTFLNGSKRTSGPTAEPSEEKKENVESKKEKDMTKKITQLPVDKKNAEAKKKAAAKKAPAKKAPVKKSSAPKSPSKKGPDQPFGWIIAYVQEKKKVTRDDIRKALAKDYAPSTVNVQMARLKNSPLLKVDGDTVTPKK